MKKRNLRKARQLIMEQKRDANYHRRQMEYYEEYAKALEQELENCKKDKEDD